MGRLLFFFFLFRGSNLNFGISLVWFKFWGCLLISFSFIFFFSLFLFPSYFILFYFILFFGFHFIIILDSF
ncbi:hypothetical protein P170DRAFT_50889 [Aspergillus steynii IBT 23096]|uniref:Uncharacterized protein n=1 Tax=Aspergillus steynii IBT 23096 TaxID=1392250 RepID=A0A2I2GSK2_9EURO|nr:uncharacterized protein P170DRAFT_50889 [Aspergillus steynii IBT 23096]PLB55848.1 hypothetical protein P170DRAFT_50889 [Aspergillus steynii IBT 23096]